jgi:hypothetical protein
MDCLHRCITPREKKGHENSVKENGTEPETNNYSARYTTRGSRSYDDLQRLKQKYDSIRNSNPSPIIIDHEYFLCSHCYTKCLGCCNESTTNNLFYADKDTFSHQQQKKYADDGSFLMFHIKVLFCLE